MAVTRSMKSESTFSSEEKKDESDFPADDLAAGGSDHNIHQAPKHELPLPQSQLDSLSHDKIPRNDVNNNNGMGKNDCEDDNETSNKTSNKTSPQSNTSRSTSSNNNNNRKPLLLLLCAFGITSCYLWYGTVQEKLFVKHHHHSGGNSGSHSNKEGPDEDDNVTLFLLATGTFSSFFIGWIWTWLRPVLLGDNKVEDEKHTGKGKRFDGDDHTLKCDKTDGKLNHPLMILTSLAYLTAMAASNEALHYVSYPTCVLAKSSKLIPTMIVGWLVDTYRGWKIGHGDGKGMLGNAKTNHHSHATSTINAMEWIGAAFITIGIISFQYIQLQNQQQRNQSGNGKSSEMEGDSPYGLALLGLSLFMDGLLGACQNLLKAKRKEKSNNTTGTDKSNSTATTSSKTSSSTVYRPPTAMETMLYINLYATIVLLPASYYAGQFQNGMRMLFPPSSTDTSSSIENKSSLLVQLNLSASLGQVFIFLTIHHFSPLICTTITTTRKFFTILLSVYKFGHVLDVWQWGSVGLVFGGLYLEIAAKLFEGREKNSKTNAIAMNESTSRVVESQRVLKKKKEL
mmetsp:Transcript_23261/g.49126  ORF Transcript_23261/g.49126 Transcript_23261/m.49126 type:complete len:568 (-) Transcript_23261:107-1810(-)